MVRTIVGGARPLLEGYLAAAIRSLFDGIDQAMQVDRGFEGRFLYRGPCQASV
jgi:hypothetical protein